MCCVFGESFREGVMVVVIGNRGSYGIEYE